MLQQEAKGRDKSFAEFAANKIGILLEGDYFWRSVVEPKEGVAKMADRDTAVGYALIPAAGRGAGVEGQDFVIMSGGGATVINPNTKFPQQAWELLQFMNSAEAIKAPAGRRGADHPARRRQQRGAGRRPDAELHRHQGAADHAVPAGPGGVPAGLGRAAAGDRGRGRRQEPDDAAAAYQKARRGGRRRQGQGRRRLSSASAAAPAAGRRPAEPARAGRPPDAAGLGVGRALGFVAPALLLIGVFLVFPALWTIYIGAHQLPAHRVEAVVARVRRAVDNYTKALNDALFHNALWLTLLFVLGSAVIGQNMLGFALAWMMRAARPGVRRTVEALVLLAWILPGVGGRVPVDRAARPRRRHAQHACSARRGRPG